jgi:hypothetical protein
MFQFAAIALPQPPFNKVEIAQFQGCGENDNSNQK